MNNPDFFDKLMLDKFTEDNALLSHRDIEFRREFNALLKKYGVWILASNILGTIELAYDLDKTVRPLAIGKEAALYGYDAPIDNEYLHNFSREG